jgi:hypothetical protein
MATKSYESPLTPHARMRALFRALVEARALSAHLGRHEGGLAPRTEAPWAAAALELSPGDLLSCPGGRTSVAEHIRSIGTRIGSGAPRASSFRSSLATRSTPFSGGEPDRLLCAAGAAMALKASGAGNVVVAFARKDALQAAAWMKLLRLVFEAELPLLLVVFASRKTQLAADLDRLADRATRPPVPVIPVDGADPIALYRVAAESIGRARTGGGAAVLLAETSRTDPIRLLQEQLLTRGIATPRWLTGVAPATQAALGDAMTAIAGNGPKGSGRANASA